MLGIYAYFDKKDNSVVYVGKDSYIDENRRDKEHHKPSRYWKQSFNRVLQNNPNRYTYQVLVYDVKDQETLNGLEIQYIRQLKPKFNFTDGGDGAIGYKWTEKQKRRVSKSLKGKSKSEEHRRNISKGRKGMTLSESHCKNLSKSHKGLFMGKEHPMSKYENLWDNSVVKYDKSKMFRNNREPNPCNCFRLKYKGSDVLIGQFMDFTSVEIINGIIEKVGEI